MLNKPGLDQIFHALGDRTRRAMLERLSRGPASVSELAAPMDMSLAAVMQHLQVLEDTKLVRSQKQGRVRTCTIDPDVLARAEAWLTGRRELWEHQFDQLGVFLAETKPKARKKKRTS